MGRGREGMVGKCEGRDVRGDRRYGVNVCAGGVADRCEDTQVRQVISTRGMRIVSCLSLHILCTGCLVEEDDLSRCKIISSSVVCARRQYFLEIFCLDVHAHVEQTTTH
jgi:hypothetical protein